MKNTPLENHKTGAYEIIKLLRSRNDKQLLEISPLFDDMTPNKIQENTYHLRKYIELLEESAMVNI